MHIAPKDPIATLVRSLETVRTILGRTDPAEDDFELFEVYHFPQEWSSTALGFGGIGGLAMTSAYTTIVLDGLRAFVFFAGRHAYTVERIDATFLEDMRLGRLAEVDDAGRYGFVQRGVDA